VLNLDWLHCHRLMLLGLILSRSHYVLSSNFYFLFLFYTLLYDFIINITIIYSFESSRNASLQYMQYSITGRQQDLA